MSKYAFEDTLIETTPILDFGLAASSGQTIRRYFANFQHSPNLDTSTNSFVNSIAEWIPSKGIVTTRLQSTTNNK